MAILANTINAQDLTNWGALASITSLLYVDGTKILIISNDDPLVDHSITAPQDSIQVSG